MELNRKFTYLAIICLAVVVLCPLVEGNCQETIMQKPGFMECIMGFSTFFSNMGNSGTDANIADEDSVFKAICSDEGKAAFQCIIGFMKECPELLSGSGGSDNPMAALGQIPGFDMNEFLQEGAMDATCALFVGPCSKVKECFTMPQSSGGVVKRGVPSSMNNYLLFQSQTSMMCGPMKDRMDCMINALADCPESVVSKVEAQFESAMNMSTSGQQGSVVSFKDTKIFIQKQCSKLPSDNTCLQSVFLSENFTECDQQVANTYSKEKTCAIHRESVDCIMENVEPQCGQQSAAFLSQNTHMIYPGIPSDCQEDVSGSNTVQTSLELLLIASFTFFIL